MVKVVQAIQVINTIITSVAERKKDCKKKSVKKDYIERAAVVLTVNRVLQDEEISRIADSIISLQNSENTTVPALKKQLAETERGIENMLNAIQQGILTASTKDRLEALEKQKEDLKIAIMQAELQKPKYTKEQIVSWISQFKYGDVNSREYQKRIIDTFVNAIFLFDDYLAITYNFKGGTETITLKDIEAVYGSDLNALSPPKRKIRRKSSLSFCDQSADVGTSNYDTPRIPCSGTETLKGIIMYNFESILSLGVFWYTAKDLDYTKK